MESALTEWPEGERRRCRRSSDPLEHGIQSVRIKFGDAAAVVNVSPTGALIETRHRLLPGACVELHMETVNRRASVRGRVARCAVVHVRAATVLYHGAINFDQHLPWCVPEEGYSLPSTEQSDPHGRRADATRVVL